MSRGGGGDEGMGRWWLKTKLDFKRTPRGFEAAKCEAAINGMRHNRKASACSRCNLERLVVLQHFHFVELVKCLTNGTEVSKMYAIRVLELA